MEPASQIIRKVGGAQKASEITGASIGAPYRWQYEKSKGGTGGLIPQRYHRTLLDYAEQNGIELSADDFLPPREVTQ
jgi:hypothetical protein